MTDRNRHNKKEEPRLPKKERSRIKIMHAAKVLFDKYGTDAVTFQMIADEAEMCRTTVFNHFNGMEELMLALINGEIADIEDYCREKKLRGMDLILGLYDKLIEDTSYYPALTSTLISNAITSKDEENPVRVIEEMTVRGMEEAGAAEPEQSALLVEGAYYGIVNHCHAYNLDFDADRLKKEFRELLNNIIGGSK